MADQKDVKTESNEDKEVTQNGNERNQGGFRGGRGRGGGPGRFQGPRRNFNNKPDDAESGNQQGGGGLNKPRRPQGPGGQRGGGHGGQRGGGHGGGGGPGGDFNRMQGGPAERNMHDKLMQIMGPTFDLNPLDQTEKKFSGRSRLYIGNIAPDATDEELTALFEKFGETSELFVNRDKFFGFIRMDYHFNAAKAKGELDGFVFKGKTLKVRFSPNGSTLKVKNLDDFVTNELLHMGFSVFGDIDRCVVIVDDRGKPTGEAIVEYARKSSAQFALRKCCEGCFFLTSSLRPVLVESYEVLDETDGYPDKLVQKRHPDYFKMRNVGPRFANSSSFEHEYGMRWKQLFELYAQKEESLKKELELEKEKLIAQMEYARFEHETEMLREQLRAREMDMDRQKREWEMKQLQADEARQRQVELRQRQEEEMQAHILRQEEEMRRRQEENNLFRQAHQLDSMLNQQEQAYDKDRRNFDDQDGTMDPKTFFNNFNNRDGGYFEGREGGHNNRGSRWTQERGHDDYPNKRRRF